jgi:hypothetical protein
MWETLQVTVPKPLEDFSYDLAAGPELPFSAKSRRLEKQSVL